MKVTDEMLSEELKLAERDAQLQKYITELKKKDFINEIKSGLGQEIKQKPNQLKIIKKPWHKKLKIFLGKIFTKF
jgi:hypothetical protein